MLSFVSTNDKQDKSILFLSHYSLLYVNNQSKSEFSNQSETSSLSSFAPISNFFHALESPREESLNSPKKKMFNLINRNSSSMKTPITLNNEPESPRNSVFQKNRKSLGTKSSPLPQTTETPSSELPSPRNYQPFKRFSNTPKSSPSPQIPQTPEASPTTKTSFLSFKNSRAFSIFKKKTEEIPALVRSHSDNLMKILKDIDKRILFKEYAKKEYSDENIRFWEDVQIFKSMEDLEMKLDKMEEIQKNYLTNGAIYEINISLKLVEVVKEKIFQNLLNNEIEDDKLFDCIANDLIGGILNDTFSRFRFHESYLNLKLKE
jgi:hypothetical protein